MPRQPLLRTVLTIRHQASVLQPPQQTIQQLPTSVCFTLTLSRSSADPLTRGSPYQTALKPNLCLLVSFLFQREKVPDTELQYVQSNIRLARLVHGEAVELQMNSVWDLVNLYRHCVTLCPCVHWWIQK